MNCYLLWWLWPTHIIDILLLWWLWPTSAESNANPSKSCIFFQGWSSHNNSSNYYKSQFIYSRANKHLYRSQKTNLKQNQVVWNPECWNYLYHSVCSIPLFFVLQYFSLWKLKVFSNKLQLFVLPSKCPFPAYFSLPSSMRSESFFIPFCI